MASARTLGICDRCNAAWGGRRRLCTACRRQLRPLAAQYKELHAQRGRDNAERHVRYAAYLQEKDKHDERLRGKHQKP